MSEKPSPSASTLLATTKKYLEVYATLDPETLKPIQSPNFIHVFAPSSIDPPPPLTAEAFAQHVSKVRTILSKFPVIPKETWPNPSLRQVTIWAEAEPHFHEDVMDSENKDEWKYRGEYIYMLEMDETGEKIQRVLEFLDSFGTQRLRQLMGRAFKRREELSGVEESASAWNFTTK